MYRQPEIGHKDMEYNVLKSVTIFDSFLAQYYPLFTGYTDRAWYEMIGTD